MNISVITENMELVSYLTNSSSLTIINHYTNLVDQYDKFINDLNKVDVLLLVDYIDLAQNLSKIINCINLGNNYLLKVGEILVITYKDYKSSPTVNAEYKFSAFTEFLESSHYKVRIVQLERIDFRTIYENIIKETTLTDNEILVYSKYKVNKSSGGVNQVPKKSKEYIVPESIQEVETLKDQDKIISNSLSTDKLYVPIYKEKIDRLNKDYVKVDTVNSTVVPLFIVSGLKYAGKSTFILNLLNEFNSLDFNLVVVDTQGFSDYHRLQEINKYKFPILKGNDIFKSVDNNSIIIELYHRAYTSNFLNSLKHLFRGKIGVICEINIDDINNYYISYPDKREVYIITEYDFTKIRDLTYRLKSLTVDINIIINDRNDTGIVLNLDNIKQTLNEYLPSIKYIGLMSNLSNIMSNMGVN